jgi:hypothetical protein
LADWAGSNPTKPCLFEPKFKLSGFGGFENISELQIVGALTHALSLTLMMRHAEVKNLGDFFGL